MMNKDEFYIGWQPNAPEGFAKKAKQFVILVAVLVPILAFTIVTQQRGFSNANFEFGTLTTVEGVLSVQPVPMLIVQSGNNPQGRIVQQRILLVSAGKFGALEILERIKDRGNNWEELDNKMVQLRGTLIYKEGKTLLELTEGKNSIMQVNKSASTATVKNDYGLVTLKGEIMDAKCHFGVMKPGEGKPHRACAVRCIAGGIPPVLKTSNKAGESNYFILLDANGNPINHQVLDYVGEPIALCGKLEKMDDWFYLYVNLEVGIERLGAGLMEDLPMCNS